MGVFKLDLFLGIIGFLGIIVGIVLIVIGLIIKKKRKGGLIFIVSFFIFLIAIILGITKNEASDKIKEPVVDTEEKVETEEVTLTDTQKETISALNDFQLFISHYKGLGNYKTPTWDNYLNGERVTWKGTIMELGGQQVYIWGSEGYIGQTWTDVSNGSDHEAYNVFIADFGEDIPQSFKVGDEVTVQGTLESRGDYDLNYHWKLYNSTFK